MTHFSRNLNLLPLRKSLFLFGPRQTGKSTLLKEVFTQAKMINLLDESVYADFAAEPGLLVKRLKHLKNEIIIIDEIQRLPSLLNDVHLLIEENHLTFILTGSSTRQLKASGVNLLGGRALERKLHPINFKEIGIEPVEAIYKLSTLGGLPSILNSSDPIEDLNSYTNLYLYHEIKAESKIRKIKPFSDFLKIAAGETGKQVNISALASDVGLSRDTIYEYFKILEDTLMGEMLLPFRTPNRKSASFSKFYCFDVGVANILSGRLHPTQGLKDYGISFEHFLWREIRTALDYLKSTQKLYYWRTQEKSPLEVDFVLAQDEREIDLAIEVKTATSVQSADTRGLVALGEIYPRCRRILVYQGKHRKSEGRDYSIEVVPVAEFLIELWSGKILK